MKKYLLVWSEISIYTRLLKGRKTKNKQASIHPKKQQYVEHLSSLYRSTCGDETLNRTIGITVLQLFPLRRGKYNIHSLIKSEQVSEQGEQCWVILAMAIRKDFSEVETVSWDTQYKNGVWGWKFQSNILLMPV